jgi:phage shock protein C
VLAYLLALIVVPSAPEPSPEKNTKTPQNAPPKGNDHSTKNTAFYFGVFLISLGTLFLLKEWTQDWIDPVRFRWNWDWTWGRFWPLLLVVVGSLYLAETIRKKPKTDPVNGKKTLYRSQKSKVFAGVCGGIAEYFQVDAAFIRIALAVVAVTTSMIFWIVAYAVSAMFLPFQNGGEPAVESK